VSFMKRFTPYEFGRIITAKGALFSIYPVYRIPVLLLMERLFRIRPRVFGNIFNKFPSSSGPFAIDRSIITAIETNIGSVAITCSKHTTNEIESFCNIVNPNPFRFSAMSFRLSLDSGTITVVCCRCLENASKGNVHSLVVRILQKGVTKVAHPHDFTNTVY